jgi:hypothetical protein
VWEECAGSDRAVVGLREQWLKDLEAVNKAAGIRSIRFHGLFNDEMGVWPAGAKQPNFLYVDMVFRRADVDLRHFVRFHAAGVFDGHVDVEAAVGRLLYLQPGVVKPGVAQRIGRTRGSSRIVPGLTLAARQNSSSLCRRRSPAGVNRFWMSPQAECFIPETTSWEMARAPRGESHLLLGSICLMNRSQNRTARSTHPSAFVPVPSPKPCSKFSNLWNSTGVPALRRAEIRRSIT